MKNRIIWKFYLISFLSGLWFSGPVLIPFFKEWGGINQFEIQVLQSWYMVILSVVMMPTSVFADRFGRKKSLIIGYLIGSLAIVWYGTIGGFLAFFLGEILFGLHSGFITGADRAHLTALIHKESRSVRLSRVFANAFLAHMAALLIAGPIGRRLAVFGLNIPVIMSAVPILLVVPILLTLPETTGNHRPSWLISVKRGLTYLLRHPQHKRAALAAVATSTAGYFVYWLYPALIGELSSAESLNTSTWVFGLIIAGEVAVTLVFRRLSDQGQQYLLTLGRWAALVGFLAAIVLPGNIGLAVFAGLAGGFGLSYWNMFSAELQQHLPEEELAAINSGADTLRQVSLIIANPLIGWLILTHPQTGFIACTAIAAAGIIIKPRSQAP